MGSHCEYGRAAHAARAGSADAGVPQFRRSLAGVKNGGIPATGVRLSPGFSAEREWQQLRTFAAQELNSPELAPWDIAFAAEKLRQSRYAFSEHEVRQYFP